jgi:hypothetical protein
VQLSREFLHVIFNVSWVLQLGVLVLLAILLRRKPDLLHQQADIVRSQFQGQEKLPTLVWAYGQVAQGDLVSGMYLWVHNLLPFAVGKSSTPSSRDTVLQFVERSETFFLTGLI